jgi:hypothetical protein
MNQKYCITFAGAIGSSKTPIAHFLSCRLNLPILDNDAIRSEVTEDRGAFDEQEYQKRRDERIKEVIESGQSLIYSASVDRQWKRFREVLDETGYRYFVISMDLSRDFLVKLYHAKNYHESLAILDESRADHEVFLEGYGKEAGLHITDKEFHDRLELSYTAVKQWIG